MKSRHKPAFAVAIDAQPRQSEAEALAHINGRYGVIGHFITGFFGVLGKCVTGFFAVVGIVGGIYFPYLLSHLEPAKPQEPVKTEISKEKAELEVLARDLAGR